MLKDTDALLESNPRESTYVLVLHGSGLLRFGPANSLPARFEQPFGDRELWRKRMCPSGSVDADEIERFGVSRKQNVRTDSVDAYPQRRKGIAVLHPVNEPRRTLR